MSSHPFSSVAVAGVFNTEQARSLQGHTSLTISVAATLGVLTRAGFSREEVDGVIGSQAARLVHALGIGPIWASDAPSRPVAGISSVLMAASLVASGQCSVVVVVEGRAGSYSDRSDTAPWTRPSNEFTEPFGMYTAVEFAMIARRHMELFGTTPEHLAAVAATIRNNGMMNPQAVHHGRGPYTTSDVLESPMVADPFHLLDCAVIAEGACAILVTTLERARDCATDPVFILGGGVDVMGPHYEHAPTWDLCSATDDIPNGYIGRRAAQRAFSAAGLTPADVDCCELYDPFSFEVIRQLEAFGFCGEGEGGAFVADGNIDPEGAVPVATDGGLLSFGASGAQQVQKVARAVEQVQGVCESRRVENAEVVLCSNGGAGAMYNEVLLVGNSLP